MEWLATVGHKIQLRGILIDTSSLPSQPIPEKLSAWTKLGFGEGSLTPLIFHKISIFTRVTIPSVGLFFYCTTNPGHSGPVVTPNWYYCSANTSYIINSGSSLTFRIYAGYAHNSLGGTLILDSITVDGTDLTTLPITLTSFNAFENNRDVDITWSTATEQNNEHFIVERSEDARNYQEIARVDGAGNSQHRIDYSIVDPSPSVGWHYYRLTQVDYNGQYEVFDGQVVPVYIRGAPEIVFPNPASVGEVVHVPAGCKVIDSLGRLVQSGNDTFTPTSSGVYLVGNQKLVVR